MKIRSLTIVNVVVISCCVTLGQIVSSTPRFGVAEVQRSPTATNSLSWPAGGVLRGERYSLQNATILDLIRLAWDIQPDNIVGGPNWLEFERFDIAAKAPRATSPETIRLMLQSLLADRFELAMHRDTRPMPAYALSLGKGKPKLTEASGSGNPGCHYQSQSAGTAFVMYSCRSVTMEVFAQQLRGMAGTYINDQVVDSTGIAGDWDFDLQWNSRSRLLQNGGERTTIFDAVEKQLGLVLQPRKVPAPVMVIDRVSRNPTENPAGVEQLLPARALEFEVATVKPSRPEESESWRLLPTELEVQGETMSRLLASAFDIHWDHIDQRIGGAPKWVDTTRFDILAKTAVTNPPSPKGSSFTDDDLQLWLRALLIERFKLKTHYENRLLNAYALVAAKPKMKKADPANRARCKEAPTFPKDPRDSNPLLSRLISCQNITVSQFAQQLIGLAANDFAYPVEDATGISGNWDFTLNYTPASALRRPEHLSAENAVDPEGGVSISDAMKQQLGLKLELRKRLLPVLVIDHIEEKPTDN